MRKRWGMARARAMAMAMGWLVVAAGAIGGTIGAEAQTPIKPENTPTPAPPAELRKHIEEVRSEPEAVTDVPMENQGTKITPPPNVSPGRERGLPPPEPSVDRPNTVPELKGKARATFMRTAGQRERMAELARCREEVALDRAVKPAKVLAKGVTLRWTVGTDGRPQDVEVVASAPTDPDVLICVHKKVSAWDLTPAPTEPFRVTHQLKFK